MAKEPLREPCTGEREELGSKPEAEGGYLDVAGGDWVYNVGEQLYSRDSRESLYLNNLRVQTRSQIYRSIPAGALFVEERGVDH